MKSPRPQTAETNFRQAFERLKKGAPKVLPSGTPVSQNNVAKEAGCDPSALRKTRFPILIAEIQKHLADTGQERVHTERQRLLKQRQLSRNARETNYDLRVQRDAVASLNIEANARIAILTRRVRDLEGRIEDLQSKAQIMPLEPNKARAAPRGMDRPADK